MKTVVRHSKTVFGITCYYAICQQCGQWVKSPVGQHVWLQRHQRNKESENHKCQK